MSTDKRVYLTTTLPYVNSDPHIGFALEIVQADAFLRYKKLQGADVLLNTGTDEHGVKIYRKAVEHGKTPKEYVDEYAEKFKRLKTPLGLSDDLSFIRTTDPHHKMAAQEFWKRCAASGDIYKKNYKIKYCVGCELEKSDSELDHGKCPIHPNLELETIDEENYFFKLSKYQDRLIELYDRNPEFVVPAFRLNEIRSLIKEKGLEDFSISRLKSKMPWGVEVPEDPEHVMYVWFDALVNYISSVGWPDDMQTFEKWWPVIQFAGKDQVRQQAVMWQAMLMSAGVAPSKQIVIHGFITSGGQKMSKSLGNVVDPIKVVEEYGTDVLRYYLLRHIHPFEDSDFTIEDLKEAYNSGLANGLGNLVSRVMKMAEKNLEKTVTQHDDPLMPEFVEAFNEYDFKLAADIIWKWIGECDRRIQDTKPFQLAKENKKEAADLITGLVRDVGYIARALSPLLPETSKKIMGILSTNKMPEKPLFPRKD